MKKSFKWLSSLLVAMMIFLVALPGVNAQGTAGDFYKKVEEANKNIKNGHAKGVMSIDVIDQGKPFKFGMLDGDYKLNVKDGKISAAAIGTLDAKMLNEKPIKFEAYVDDNKAYLNDSTEWKVYDFSKMMDEIKKSANKDSKSQTMTPEQANKYFDVKEEGNEVVMTLKKGLKAEDVWADFKLDEAKKKALAQAKDQAKAKGEEFTADKESTYNKLYSVETLKLILAQNPVIEQHYDKKTNLMKKLVVDFKLPVKQIGQDIMGIAEETTEAGKSKEEAMSIPEILAVKMDLNFDGMGKEQEIKIPEAAKKAKVMEAPQKVEETTTSAQ